jgi:hypothetical protein
MDIDGVHTLLVFCVPPNFGYSESRPTGDVQIISVLVNRRSALGNPETSRQDLATNTSDVGRKRRFSVL